MPSPSRPAARLLALLAAAGAILAASGALAETQPVGRYQIHSLPLPIEGGQASTVLLDTLTGRAWYATTDDGGRPRWRAVQFFTESAQARVLPPPAGEAGEAP
jgi:hypothetical protein